MEHTVNYDTIEFVFVSLTELFCIGANGIERYYYVAIKNVALAIVESNDIGVIVMPKLFVAHFHYLLIVYKPIADFAHLTVVGRCHCFYPACGIAFSYLWELYTLCVVCYHSSFVLSFPWQKFADVPAKVYKFAHKT